MSDSDGENRIGVMGASSMVGRRLMRQLASQGIKAVAYSRKATDPSSCHIQSTYQQAPSDEIVEAWVSLAPIWILPDYFDWLAARGLRKIVVLSTTSIFTKEDSAEPAERDLAAAIQSAESQLLFWAESNNIEWVILRPTLIYQWGEDKNISEIVRFRRRFGFFPIVGQGRGLRQPISADDVAKAALQALESSKAVNKTYTISGGDTLSYREMVVRVLADAGCPSRLISLPRWLVSALVNCARVLPRYKSLSIGMADRMDRDMVFEHVEADRDFGFAPGNFSPLGPLAASKNSKKN